MDISKLRRFVAPEIVIGSGARLLVGEYASALGFVKPLVVTDEIVGKLAWMREIETELHERGYALVKFATITPNPRSSEVMAGVKSYLDARCDSIIAVGGGSVMDAAKGIGVVVANGGDVLDFEGTGSIERPMPPLICIPTTAGSASDVSQFAIINDCSRHTKIAIISKSIVPDLSIIDPNTLATLDAYFLACTGIDALTHAIEAYVSNASSLTTDLYALEAVRLISQNLVRGLEDRNNEEIQLNLMHACLFAGLAFSNASLGCVHALAHSLGGYLDLPHGECNALLLPAVIRFNYEACPERYDTIAKVMGAAIDGGDWSNRRDALANGIVALNEKVGIKGKLSQRGLKKDQIPVLANMAILDPCNATNPRQPSVDALIAILEESL